jgi:hypothetical protein
MIIYNVTIKVEHSVVANWVTWMKGIHIPELLATGLFIDTKLCLLLEQEEEDGATFVAQYFCNSMAEYTRYIDEYATLMRERSHKAFGGKFVAFRTVMEVV